LERVVVHCHALRVYAALGDGEEFLKRFARAKKFDFVGGQPPAGFWTTPNSSVEKVTAIREIQELSLHGRLVAPIRSFR
jgi:hypothetical protein